MGWVPSYEGETPTLGYRVADWMSENLSSPDAPEAEPFIPTAEQVDFLADLYEIDPHTCGRVRHRALLSRPRGWGKSPFAAAISLAEMCGPVLCDGWDADGRPVACSWQDRMYARVSIAAATQDQAVDNTWSAVLGMLDGAPACDNYDIIPGITQVTCPRGCVQFITASAGSAKGKRSVAAIMDQTETWLPGNGGVRLAQTLRNNATKLGGVTIETPNAYTVGERSVAEQSQKFADDAAAGHIKAQAAASLLYSHRGAPWETDIGDWDSLIAGLRVAYGDSSGHPGGCVIHDPPCPPGWVDLERVAADFWDTSNDPEVMRADFLNQITSASNAWLTEPQLRAAAAPDVTVDGREPVTLGFDGSEGRKEGVADATVLIGYSVRRRHIFRIGIWQQPEGPAGAGWRPPRLEIEQAVEQAFRDYNVVGFYADPSAGWAQDVKTWEARWGRRLKARMSAAEPIRYRQRDVTATCEAFAELKSEILRGDVTYDGHPQMTAHMLNARKDPRRGGYVLAKPADQQDTAKIDACWGAMMAYRAGLDATGKPGVSATSGRHVPRRLY